jgi:hypothetical protein
MSGSETVRAFRRKLPVQAVAGPMWRKPVVAIAIAATVAAFGSIVVQAGDNASVYAVADQYTNARGTPRFQLPQIFAPSPRPVARTALSYAPTYQNLAPLPATGKRTLDRSRRSEATKAAKAAKSSEWSGESDGESSSLHARTSFCVRSCDGFYFPIGNADSGSTAAHDLACQRACPGTEAMAGSRLPPTAAARPMARRARRSSIARNSTPPAPAIRPERRATIRC